MNQILRKQRSSGKAKGFTLIELMIVIAIIGILFAILIPSFINAMDRSKYRSALSAMSSLKTAAELLRTETDILAPQCVTPGGTICVCIAEEIIGMVGGAWATANDLDGRIKRSVETWGGDAGASTWSCAGMFTPVGAAEYDIKGHSARGFNECDICITEVGYEPETAQECLAKVVPGCL